MAVATDAQFHVLAVDDSLVDRKLIERLLKSSSFQVTAVDSGSKALELLGLQHQEDHKRQQQMQQQSNSPSVSSYQQEIEVSLVITDYCMPGMTGYDLLKKIKESSSLKDIPVVIMSSENVPSRINRCLEEGADEFLLKPVKLSDMKKLRPRILKGKSKEQQPQLAEQNNEEPEEAHGSQEQQQLKEQRDMLLQPLQQSNQNGTTVVGTTTKTMAGSKRKAMDSEVSPSPDERPRPNYKVKGYGLTVV